MAARQVGSVLVFLVVLLCPAVAEADSPGAQATATAHALNELANACAQRRSECPTPTPQPTATTLPTATPEPAVTVTPAPTDPPAQPIATPMPGLPVSADAPVAGYVRPISIEANADETWVELALGTGRWDVRLLSADCRDQLPNWTNVWLFLGPNGPQLADRGAYFADASEWSACQVIQSTWHSAVSCSTDGDGACVAALDPADTAIVPTVEPTSEPAPVVIYVPVPQPVPPPPPPAPSARDPEVAVLRSEVDALRAQLAAASAPIVPEPTDTPTPTATATATPTATSTATATPTPSPTPEPTPQPIASPLVLPDEDPPANARAPDQSDERVVQPIASASTSHPIQPIHLPFREALPWGERQMEIDRSLTASRLWLARLAD